MKKVIMIIISVIFISNMAAASCSITGGACSIDEIKNKNNVKTENKEKEKSNKKQDSINIRNRKNNENNNYNYKNKKQGGKVNYRLVKTVLI